MSYDFENRNYWSDRAEEMRTRADMMRDRGNREIMLRIAEDYQRLAYRAHQVPNRGQPNPTSRLAEPPNQTKPESSKR